MLRKGLNQRLTTQGSPDDPILDIVEPLSCEVLDLLGYYVVKKGVDGEIPSKSILFGRSDFLRKEILTILGILEF